MAEVSVIIPCYNHGRFLPYALQSVLAQTYDDWEAIIIDDGSTDNTQAVAAAFSDPRICYIYQENRGVSAARNEGIRRAVGFYLAFLDADDEWEQRFLEVGVKNLRDHESLTGVVTLVRFIAEDGSVLPGSGGPSAGSDEFGEQLMEGGFFPPNAVLVRAQAVRQVGMFDESLRSAEDWDLWLRIIAEGGALATVPEALARYRVYLGSMSTNAARMHDNRMAVLSKIFGAPDHDIDEWPRDKRWAFAYGHRLSAFGCLQQRDPSGAWEHLAEAARLWPGILTRLDTFYELACGDQPRGYRGEARLLDIDASAADMLQGLSRMFAGASPPVQALRRQAYGNAYLALAMLSDQAGAWGSARAYLMRAALVSPRLLGEISVLRRLVKLLAGARATKWLRSRRPNPVDRLDSGER